MRYEGIVYRPPSEAGSLLIQATIGCPHNRCTFCSLYKEKKFRIRPVEEIKADIKAACDYYGAGVQSIFFPDGNTIVMKTEQLLDIIHYARSCFPYLERITVYGSARFVNRKSLEELRSLKEAGLGRIHMGMESGDDEVLREIQKGTTAAEIIAAGTKLKQAGIEVSEYYLAGVGGKKYSQQHAVNSARVLSAFSPEYIRLRTFVPQPGTPIYEAYQKGKFELLSAHETLQEVRLLLEHLECEGSIFLSDHSINYCYVNGLLPRDKEKMMAQIDELLTYDASFFRPPHLGNL
jgi:radical SAM superfamily enzyme YgiQ (UPF0313 family)